MRPSAASVATALVVWAAALLLLLLLVPPLYFLLTLLSLPLNPWRFTTQYIEEQIAALEEAYVPHGAKHLDLPLEVRRGEGEKGSPPHLRIRIHALALKHPEPTCVTLLVHGVAGSSLTFRHLMGAISSSSTVYALDLPGFGRSHASLDYVDLVKLYDDDPVDFLCDVIEAFIQALGVSQVHLCGHSFGGYVCTRFCHRYPHRVRGMTLIHPAGVLPTLGEWGAYWAYAFKACVPGWGKYLGRPGHALAHHLLSPPLAYWYHLCAHPRGMGHLFVRDNITVTPYSAYWNTPSWTLFASLTCPVDLVYGELDTMMPAHQGVMLRDVYGHSLLVVPSKGHCPMDCVESACKVAEFMRAGACPPRRRRQRMGSPLLLPLTPSHHPSFLLRSQTQLVIHRLYSLMNSKRQTFRLYFSCKYPGLDYDDVKRIAKIRDERLSPEEQEWKLRFLEARYQWNFRKYVHETLHV